MNGNEWPLVFFTLFSQASWGILITGGLLLVAKQQLGLSAEPLRMLTAFSLVLMGLALLLSFLHLSRPHISVYSLHNLGSSWLSREIVFALGFFSLLVLAFVLMRFKLAKPGVPTLAYVAACVAGFLLVFSMVRLYMIPTVPSWNHPGTPLSFFNSSLLLGGILSLLALVYMAYRGPVIPGMAGLTKILLIVVLAGAIIHMGHLFIGWGRPIAETGSFPPPQLPAVFRYLQMVFLLVGILFLLAWNGLGGGSPFWGHPVWVGLAAGGFFMAELLGRWLFYASYYRLGV